MRLQLTCGDRWTIPISVEAQLPEAVEVQLERAYRQGREEMLLGRLSIAVAEAVAECLDSDLRPPSGRQVKFATAIARELNIALPGEALRYRGAINEFIQRFSPAFEQSRRRR